MNDAMSQYPHIPDEHHPEYEARAAARGAAMTGRDWAVIDRIYRDYPLCTVCRHPMVAGQVGTHLSCKKPSARKESTT